MPKTLKVATCQFPVCGDVPANARWIMRFLDDAAAHKADLVHFCEAALSGYGGKDIPSFAEKDYPWRALRDETGRIMDRARRLGLWVILGSAHYLSPRLKPTNCLYLISPDGRIADRYDKSMCTRGDLAHYTAGNHFVTFTVKDLTCGLLICYDGCFPEMYNAYRHRGVTLMFHSFYNAKDAGENCLAEMVPAQVRTRAADNTMWVIANNSCAPRQQWPSCIGRPDGTMAGALERNVPGILYHEFPDSKLAGWLHNDKLMKLPGNEVFSNGKPSRHRRYVDRQSPP